MGIVAVLGVGGSVVSNGIKEGVNVMIPGVASWITQLGAVPALVGRTFVLAPRYAVSIATTDWSWFRVQWG